VISLNFIANRGWTREEFNAIFTCELVEHAHLIPPVWHGVTRNEVFTANGRGIATACGEFLRTRAGPSANSSRLSASANLNLGRDDGGPPVLE
jgi:hypothetical protein